MRNNKKSVLVLLAGVICIVAIFVTNFYQDSASPNEKIAISSMIVEKEPEESLNGFTPKPNLETKQDQVEKIDLAKKEKIENALNRFESTLEQITASDLEVEQKKMKAAKIKFQKIKVDDPLETEVIDKNGIKWTKLTYPSGKVKYDFPEK